MFDYPCFDDVVLLISVRRVKFLNMCIPGSVTDALDPDNHHVIHNVCPC